MWDYLRTPTTKKPAAELDNGYWLSPGHPAEDALAAPPANLQLAWERRTARAVGGASRGEGPAFTVLQLHDLLRERPEYRVEVPGLAMPKGSVEIL